VQRPAGPEWGDGGRRDRRCCGPRSTPRSWRPCRGAARAVPGWPKAVSAPDALPRTAPARCARAASRALSPNSTRGSNVEAGATARRAARPCLHDAGTSGGEVTLRTARHVSQGLESIAHQCSTNVLGPQRRRRGKEAWGDFAEHLWSEISRSSTRRPRAAVGSRARRDGAARSSSASGAGWMTSRSGRSQCGGPSPRTSPRARRGRGAAVVARLDEHVCCRSRRFGAVAEGRSSSARPVGLPQRDRGRPTSKPRRARARRRRSARRGCPAQA